MPENKKNPLILESVTWRKTGDEAVILDLESSNYYSANDTGTYVWEQFSAGKKPEKIAENLAEEYGIAPAQARLDVKDFLKDLARFKIVRPEAAK
ncbi:MAG: PqqD family protein [Elusimicrobiales bacterium]